MDRVVFRSGHEPEEVRSLREDFATADADKAHIRHITLVGANYQACFLHEDDVEWLHYAMELCWRQGIEISRDFTLTPLNIASKAGKLLTQKGQYNDGDDFLKVTIPTDLLVICYVFNTPSPILTALSFTEGFEKFRTSNLHFVENAWRDAAERSGAKVIITFARRTPIEKGDPEEVTIRDFTSPAYLVRAGSESDGGNDIMAHEILVRKNLIPQLPTPLFQL